MFVRKKERNITIQGSIWCRKSDTKKSKHLDHTHTHTHTHIHAGTQKYEWLGGACVSSSG